MAKPIYCEGAVIENSYIQVIGTNEDCLRAEGENLSVNISKIYNSTLIANGNGKSISSGGSNNSSNSIGVVSTHNRMNKEMGDEIINMVLTPYDVIDENTT